MVKTVSGIILLIWELMNFMIRIQLPSIIENAKELNIFPNPTNHWINIVCNSINNPYVNIYSITGQLQIKTQSKKIDLSELPKGIYIVEVGGEKFKIIKK